VIVYVDSSILARAYLSDEPGHAEAVGLLNSADTGLITGSWTPIEVSGALVRAARAGRGDEAGLLALLDGDLGDDGAIAVVGADQAEVQALALRLVRSHGIRAMDAWHVAVAALVLPRLAEPGEQLAFASRDTAQSEVAQSLGLAPWTPARPGG
jgi:predicted nucleic acid-binding protein